MQSSFSATTWASEHINPTSWRITFNNYVVLLHEHLAEHINPASWRNTSNMQSFSTTTWNCVIQALAWGKILCELPVRVALITTVICATELLELGFVLLSSTKVKPIVEKRSFWCGSAYQWQRKHGRASLKTNFATRQCLSLRLRVQAVILYLVSGVPLLWFRFVFLSSTKVKQGVEKRSSRPAGAQ